MVFGLWTAVASGQLGFILTQDDDDLLMNKIHRVTKNGAFSTLGEDLLNQ